MQDNINSLVSTKDGSNTLFSQRYNQHYHNPDDGAIDESLSKHIIPTFTFHLNNQDIKELNILDICFGIGYNTFSTIYYVLKNNLKIKLNIYSPELDGALVKSLDTFLFPKEFDDIKHIINSISKTCKYEDENIKIEVFIGDARDYIKSLPKDFFHIVYQDAFSSEVNFELWTKEYFDDIYKLCKDDCVVSSYDQLSEKSLWLLNKNKNLLGSLWIWSLKNKGIKKLLLFMINSLKTIYLLRKIF